MAYKPTGRPPGRRRHPDARVIAARNPFSGRVIAWSNGHWAGDPELVRTARVMCAARTALDVPGLHVPARADADSHLVAWLMLRDTRLTGAHATVTGDVPLDELLALWAIDALDLDLTGDDDAELEVA